MFFEFITLRNEKVSININHILFVTPTKKGTMLVDVNNNDYETLESYTNVIFRLNNLELSKSAKTY